MLALHRHMVIVITLTFFIITLYASHVFGSNTLDRAEMCEAYP